MVKILKYGLTHFPAENLPFSRTLTKNPTYGKKKEKKRNAPNALCKTSAPGLFYQIIIPSSDY